MANNNRLRNYSLGFFGGLALAFVVGYSLWGPAVELDYKIAADTKNQSAKYADPALIGGECDTEVGPDARPGNCIASNKEAAHEAERSSYDLEAQQTVAVWTRVMGKAAVVGMGVGILSLFLIFVTFWETRKAADAGREANNIAKDLQRARILPSARVFPITLNELSVVLGCENAGLSPATNLRCALTVELDPPRNLPHFDEWGEKHIIKAGDRTDLVEMADGVLDGVIVGCIEYDTLFEKNRRTFVCFKFVQRVGTQNWYAVDCRPDTWPNDT